MRFPVAAIFLVILEFIVFVGYAVLSFLLEVISDELTPLANAFSSTSRVMFLGEIDNLTLAFGVVTILLMMLIIVVFIVDSLREEPETYYHERGGYQY